MAKIIQASTLRNHLADALEEVEGPEKFLLVARNRDLVSALVDIDFFEDLLASRSPKYLKSIREARRQYEQGEVVSHQEIFGRL